MVKRIRCSNWEQQEKILLRIILKPYIHIIENKDSTTKTNNIKRKAWSEITEKFNKSNFRVRDKKQLLNQWRVTKMNLNPNQKKKTFKYQGCPSLSQETNVDRKFKVESDMDSDQIKEILTEDGSHKDPIEFLNITIEEMNPQLEELSPSTSQETLVSNGNSSSASPSQPVPSPIQLTAENNERSFRKSCEQNNITGRSHLDTNYFRTQENKRLEKEHLFRMHTMAEFHDQTMRNLKLQEQIYEKILENYYKQTT